MFGHWEGETAKVEVQKAGRGVPGEARVKTGVPRESGEEGEGRGASPTGTHMTSHNPVSHLAPRIQGYPRAHCLLHTAYHGFVWQLVWILSLQPKLVSDLKTCPTSVLRFDMNVKSVPIKRWLLPGGAGMSLGTHAARGHRICKPQGPRRSCPSSQANLEKQRWGNNQGGRESSLAKHCKEVEQNPVPSAPPGRGFTPSRSEVLPFFVRRN